MTQRKVQCTPSEANKCNPFLLEHLNAIQAYAYKEGIEILDYLISKFRLMFVCLHSMLNKGWQTSQPLIGHECIYIFSFLRELHLLPAFIPLWLMRLGIQYEQQHIFQLNNLKMIWNFHNVLKPRESYKNNENLQSIHPSTILWCGLLGPWIAARRGRLFVYIQETHL